MAEPTTSSLKSYWSLIVSITLVVTATAFVFYHMGNKIGAMEAEREFLEISMDINDVEEIEGDFSEVKFRNFLNKMNVAFPDIVYAQALLETGHFSSSIFEDNNNLFGMKKASRRPTTCIGTKNGHALYESWQDSVIDYLIYQRIYLKKVQTHDEYYAHLSNYYAEDPSYSTKLKKLTGLY